MSNGNNRYIPYSYINKRVNDGFNTLQLKDFRRQLWKAVGTLSSEHLFNSMQQRIANQARYERNVSNLLGEQLQTAVPFSKKQLKKNQMHEAIYFIVRMKISHESQHEELSRMPMTVYIYQHINVSFLRQAVLDSKITARAGFPPFSFEYAVLNAKSGKPFQGVPLQSSVCAMFASFLQQQLVNAGHKTAGVFHYSAYLVHAFVLLHSFFNFWNELLHDTTERVTTAIDPKHRVFMQNTEQFSFTQVLNIVVYYSADRPVSKVSDISDFSRSDMFHQMLVKNNRSVVKVEVQFGAPLSQEVYRKNIKDRQTNKSTIIKHKPRTWHMNLLGQPQIDARQMLEDSYQALSKRATAGLDSATQADSHDQIYLITAFILLLLNAPGVSPYHQGDNLYQQDNTAIIATRGKKGILKGNYSYGPSYFMNQFYKFFKRHGNLQAAQQRFFQNACLIHPYHKLLLNNKNVPCLLECACLILSEQYMILRQDRQNKDIKTAHPLEALLDTIFDMELISDLVMRRVVNDNNRCTVNQADRTLWQQFCQIIGFFTGPQGKDVALIRSDYMSCVVSFIDSLARLFYLPTQNSEQTGNNLLLPHIIMMDELLLSINYKMLSGQLLEQIEKDQAEVGGVINILEWNMFEYDMGENQCNMFYLLRTIEKIYRENCSEQNINLHRSFCIPSLVTQDLYKNTANANNLVLVLMDNHVQVCDMVSINKVIVFYVRYLMQIKQSNQVLYDRRRTATLLQSQNGSEGDIDSQFFYDEAEEERPQVYMDPDQEDDEADAVSEFRSDPSQITVKGKVKKINSLGMRKFKFLLDNIYMVYGAKSTFTEDQKNSSLVIENLVMSNTYFKQNIQRFNAVAPQHLEDAKKHRLNQFNKFGMAGIDIETCTIPLSTETDNEDKTLQQIYGFDPETVGNQVPWMVSIVGALYSCIDKQMHCIDKVFTSNPQKIDTCIDQLIVYLFQEGFMYNEDEVDAQKCPASGQDMFQSCTNLLYTFNGANFDHKFIFPRLQKFCNVKWIQGSFKSIKQFSTYNCVFGDLAQFFVGQSLAAVSKAWLKDTQWECYIKFKLDGEIQPALPAVQDMLLVYNQLHQFSVRVESSDINMFEITNIEDVKLISFFDHLNEQPEFNFSSIDKTDIEKFYDLYQRAFNFVQYCRQDSCATYYSTKRFFQTLYDINIKNEATYASSDMYALLHSYDIPNSKSDEQIIGKNFQTSSKYVRAIRDMLRRGVTLFNYFSLIDGVSEETSDYECFKFTYYSFMQSSVPLGSAALCLDMAKDTFGVSLPSIPALHDIEKQSYAGGLTQQIMRDYVLGISIDINSAYPTAYLQDLPVYIEALVLSGYIFQEYGNKSGTKRHNNVNSKEIMSKLDHVGDLYKNGDEDFQDDPQFAAYMKRVTDPANYSRIVNLCTNVNTDNAQVMQDKDDLCVLSVSENLQSKFSEFVPYHLYRVTKFKFNPRLTFVPCIPVKVFDMLFVTPMSYDREQDTYNKIHEYVNNKELTTTYEERRNNRGTIIDEILKLNDDSRFEQEQFMRKYKKENDQYIELWVWGVQLNQAKLQGAETLCVDKVIRYVGMPFLEDYCQVLYQLKSTTKSSCKKILYKLLLNALYGKFAQKIYPATCYVQSNELISSYLDVYYKNGEDDGIAVQQASKLGGFTQYAIKYQDLAQKFNKTGILVRIASFITTTARANLLQGAHQVSYYLNTYKNILSLEPHHVIAYMDTDSLYIALDIVLIKDVEGFGPVLFNELKKRQVQELLNNDTTQQYKDYLVSDTVMQKALKYVCDVIRYIQENCAQIDQKYMSNRIYSQFWQELQPPSVKMIHQTRLGAFKIEKLVMNFIALGQKLYTAYYIEDDVFDWSPELFKDVEKIKVDVKLKGVSRTVVANLGRNIIKDMIRDSHVQESLQDQNVGSKRREVTLLASTVTPVLQTWSKEYVDGSMISYQRKIISESGYKVACLDTIMPLSDESRHKFWPNIKALYNYYMCTRCDDMSFTSEVMKMTCIINDSSIDEIIEKLQDTERIICQETIDRDYKLSNIANCDKLAQKMYLNIQVNRKFKEINEKIRCVHYMQLKREQILKERSQNQLSNDMQQLEDFIEGNEIDNMHNNIIRRNILPMTMQTKDQFNGQSVGINQTSTERLYYDTLFNIDLIGVKSKSNSVTPIVREQFKQTLDLMDRMYFYVMMMSDICNQDLQQCEYMDWAYELSKCKSFKFNSMGNDSSASEGSATSKKSKSSSRFHNCKAIYNKHGHQKRHVTGLVMPRAYNKMISKIIPFVKKLADLSPYGSHFEQISPYFMFQYIVFVMNLMRQSFTSMDVESCLDQCYYQGRDTILKQYTMAAYSHSMKPSYHNHDNEDMRLIEFNLMLDIINDKMSPATLEDIKHTHVKTSLRSILNFVSCNVMSKEDKMVNTFARSFDIIANSISARSTEGMTEANVESFMKSQKITIEANKSQIYFNIDNEDATSKCSFNVPGGYLTYDTSSEEEKKNVPQFSLKKAASYNKDGTNYTQLMNAYKMSAYSLPVHYQLINQISIHFMRVLNLSDRCIFTNKMIEHVSDILAKSRPKNEYKEFAPAVVMIAYVYALGLHKSTRDTWSKLIFQAPYISEHFVPVVNIDNDVTAANAVDLFNGNCFVNCVLSILELPSLRTFITKNLCHSKKLMYNKVNHIQQTCLIHLNACWHYMTKNCIPYEGGLTFPAMRMIESFDATSIPSDFNKNKLKCSEVELKSEYILYLWQKVFKRFMNHAMVKNNKPSKLQNIGKSIIKSIEYAQVSQLQDNENIAGEIVAKIEKSKVKISFDFTVIDQLKRNMDYVDMYVHDQKNKKEKYMEILMKQNKALQELDKLIVTGAQVNDNNIQDNNDEEMIIT